MLYNVVVGVLRIAIMQKERYEEIQLESTQSVIRTGPKVLQIGG